MFLSCGGCADLNKGMHFWMLIFAWIYVFQIEYACLRFTNWTTERERKKEKTTSFVCYIGHRNVRHRPQNHRRKTLTSAVRPMRWIINMTFCVYKSVSVRLADANVLLSSFLHTKLSVDDWCTGEKTQTLKTKPRQFNFVLCRCDVVSCRTTFSCFIDACFDECRSIRCAPTFVACGSEKNM